MKDDLVVLNVIVVIHLSQLHFGHYDFKVVTLDSAEKYTCCLNRTCCFNKARSTSHFLVKVI